MDRTNSFQNRNLNKDLNKLQKLLTRIFLQKKKKKIIKTIMI